MTEHFNWNEENYLSSLHDVLFTGTPREDRTGTGTISLFGTRTEYDLQHGFPLLTTKKTYFKGIVFELLWFLKGSTNISYLKDNGVKIWNEWADSDGELGPVYGKQWRNWNGIDQVETLINSIKSNPFSRRHIVSAWNVGELSDMALPPCHILWQLYVRDEFLDMQLYQRSADMFLGVPFNIASYSILLSMIAKETGYLPGKLIHVIGDAHIYHNHVDQVVKQLGRIPYNPPRLELYGDFSNLKAISPTQIGLQDYKSHPGIKGEISV